MGCSLLIPSTSSLRRHPCYKLILKINSLPYSSPTFLKYSTYIYILSSCMEIQIAVFIDKESSLKPWTKRHQLYNVLANFGAKRLILCTNCTNLNCKLFQVRLVTLVIIHHKFSLPPPFQFLASFTYSKLQ